MDNTRDPPRPVCALTIADAGIRADRKAFAAHDVLASAGVMQAVADPLDARRPRPRLLPKASLLTSRCGWRRCGRSARGRPR